MSGEQLMCIWQAVLAKDANPKSGVKRATVMSVVENFAGINNIVYTERRFKEVFPDSKVRRCTVVSHSFPLALGELKRTKGVFKD